MMAKNIYLCCGVELFDGYSYISHLKDNHTNKGKFIDKFNNFTSFDCVICVERPYKRLDSLKKHLEKYHKDFLELKKLNFNTNYDSLNNQIDFQNLNFENDQEFSFICDNNLYECDVANNVEICSQPPPTYSTLIQNRPLSQAQDFSIMLQNQRIETYANQNQINKIASNVLNYVKDNLSENSNLNNQLLNNFIKISKSTYLQIKYADEVLDYYSLIVEHEAANGIKFYSLDLLTQLKHMLNKEHILKEILDDHFCKFSKLIF